jgi:hypothetical protein
LIIDGICAALMQTMDKFGGNSQRIIFSISAKDFLRYSLDWFTTGKRGVCVYRLKDGKVDDAREFIAALAFVDIPKSLISSRYGMIDQVFGPSATSTRNTSRFPKAFGTDVIGPMRDISGSLYVMLNKSQRMVVLTMPPS